MRRRFIDIGANLTDLMFQGIYHGKQVHPPDIESVLERSIKIGIEKIMITGGCLEDCQKALELAKTDDRLFTTVGVHPTRALELETDTQSRIDELVEICLNNRKKVVAVGEFGLDYDRTNFCSKDIQLKNFARQFELVERTKLPLFLHCRNSCEDFIKIIQSNRDKFKHGVVHSFDGTFDEARSILDLDLFIGLNGCSLKTSENLDVVRRLPIDRLMIETDCPYCDVRPTHASHQYVRTKNEAVKKEKWADGKMIKGRNEPCNIVQILEILSKLFEIDEDSLAETFYENSCRIFFQSI
ncbi:Putative deoxyribonuclease TATDN1 [Sarcoptes scabiei]|uniref:Deoxyribonuclease TATDN1 n=1 Tax=Sarcoptes scabiei TaxID=52283 RepID=A0A132A753_SARSC|nr:Putative deoxyribonuclease TATDN1 [Sarcoptes scabiei]KPM06806.1 deoxyribonuclease TATDN1-like protein [Sarcoptes scabiei]